MNTNNDKDIYAEGNEKFKLSNYIYISGNTIQLSPSTLLKDHFKHATRAYW